MRVASHTPLIIKGQSSSVGIDPLTIRGVLNRKLFLYIANLKRLTRGGRCIPTEFGAGGIVVLHRRIRSPAPRPPSSFFFSGAAAPNGYRARHPNQLGLWGPILRGAISRAVRAPLVPAIAVPPAPGSLGICSRSCSR